jgi:hypothetical protein
LISQKQNSVLPIVFYVPCFKSNLIRIFNLKAIVVATAAAVVVVVQMTSYFKGHVRDRWSLLQTLLQDVKQYWRSRLERKKIISKQIFTLQRFPLCMFVWRLGELVLT